MTNKRDLMGRPNRSNTYVNIPDINEMKISDTMVGDYVLDIDNNLYINDGNDYVLINKNTPLPPIPNIVKKTLYYNENEQNNVTASNFSGSSNMVIEIEALSKAQYYPNTYLYKVNFSFSNECSTNATNTDIIINDSNLIFTNVKQELIGAETFTVDLIEMSDNQGTITTTNREGYGKLLNNTTNFNIKNIIINNPNYYLIKGEFLLIGEIEINGDVLIPN